MEPQSIDSVVADSDPHSLFREDTPSPSPPATPLPHGHTPGELGNSGRNTPEHVRPPLKGRQRLLKGLQRVGSSPILIGRAARSRSNSQPPRHGGKAAVSCVSLSSGGSSYAHSYDSDVSTSAGYSTAPTSAANTPGPGSPLFETGMAKAARPRTATVSGPSSVGLPSDIRPSPRAAVDAAEGNDYFSRPRASTLPLPIPKPKKRLTDLPDEIRMHILSFLSPRDIVRCSRVSRSFHQLCFDGQLWAQLDTSSYYRNIPARALSRIITSAGPFVRDLNLRGCVQLRESWYRDGIVDACKNLKNFSIEGCLIGQKNINKFIEHNRKLGHLNLSGLAGVTNQAMEMIATHCPSLETLNISWCNNVDTRGLKAVVKGCPRLNDLRAGEVRGWDDKDFLRDLFERNTLERLVLMHCDTLDDDGLGVLMEGTDPEIDVLTDRAMVPPRSLKHLDLTRCRGITDAGILKLVGNVPFLEGLQISKCHSLTNASVDALIPTCPVLTHLGLEELENLTNGVLETLASSPCAPHLRHLCVSYCENIGDAGMAPVVEKCTRLSSLQMDNTRISDVTLTTAAAAVHSRAPAEPAPTSKLGANGRPKPHIALRIEAYDCPNVTWRGIQEILSVNAQSPLSPLPPYSALSSSFSINQLTGYPETASPPMASAATLNPSPEASPSGSPSTPSHPIITIKAFHTWQPTVDEHTKRVLRGDLVAAARLEKKWATWMELNQEAGLTGAGARRRRRRAREARLLAADEEFSGDMAGAMHAGAAGPLGGDAWGGVQDGPAGAWGRRRRGAGIGRRPRSSTVGCAVM